ncbi:T9SS type A sorting domain-containing protein [Flavobacterium sp. CBA20B-1]|uniref:T9SS type A sorting domain-containing protein n=1 Tax=unclassified Flavobacterium TaxID=196869 RepID=UPI0022256717|nr:MULTISPECIES: T9SS type A sorting domain-containing protein [unclassified Flavobacterium]WCM41478.1 T9SS type A sorting domain-containing protein [Flavobacterium sp. CBA20B-1]
MKTRIFYIAAVFLFTHLCTAQILFTENFNNYALGEVSTDATGAIPGKGGWYVRKAYPNNPAPCEIVAEAGRGNVLAIGGNINNFTQGNTSRVIQKNINTLWNGRTQGNNILKLEYDVYTVSTSVSTDKMGGYVGLSTATSNKYTVSNVIDNIVAGKPSAVNAKLQTGYYTPSGTQYIYLGVNNTPEYTNFPYNTWVSVQLFVDYEYEAGNVIGGKIYVYIPALNILKGASFTHNEIIEILHLHGGGTGNLPVAVKYDNIKLTALSTLPNYLGVENFLAENFNLYPNPANSVVNISNAENMQIQQITVYDVAGKQLSTKNYNNETEIQLNVEHLASGTYMLHLQTNQGTAVKKLVKK